MTRQETANFYKMFSPALTATAFILSFTIGANAAVVQRGTAARPTAATRPSAAASRMPTLSAAVQNATTQQPATETPATVQPAATQPVAPAPVEEDVIIEDKTSQFDEILADSAATNNSTANNALSENIRRQRAALDSQSAATTAAAQMQSALASGQNACDQGLRACMKNKCGNNFLKCRGDGDTIWGDKMDACRRDLQCTGEEYRMFAAEIKADRDLNAQLDSYNAIIKCGIEYNQCIENQCGPTFSKCLGKKFSDAAIAACEKIAKNCTQQDSGLASRTMNVMATLRQDAEKQVQKDEQRLYDLRDQMESQCKRLGAMFDGRSLDCVFTVEFYAGEGATLYASKKAYAGSTFDCDPNWFGIDVTTFKENAYRLTREQQSATSAMLGAGVGVAAGALTSGAINRAIDTQKAKNAVKKAEKEHEENYGDQEDKSDKKSKDNKTDKKDKKKTETSAPQDNKETKKPTEDTEKPGTENSTKKDGTPTGTESSDNKGNGDNAPAPDGKTGNNDTNGGSNGGAAGGDNSNSGSGNDAPAQGEGGIKTPKTQGEQGTQTKQSTDRKAARQQRRADRQTTKEAEKQSKQNASNQGTEKKNESADDTDTEYKKCESNIKMKYAFNATSQPRYKELYNTEKARIDKEWEEKLDKPYEAGTDVKGQCNGMPYTCTAGQTPRQCKPKACWYLGKKDGLFLESRIKDEFIQETVDQECAKYKK